MASSRPIVAGEDYTPDDINNLRNDVLDPATGHKHNGTDGAKVPFSNLDVTLTSGSTAPTGGSKSYNDLANHVGSSSGVHGLGDLGYVLSAVFSGLVVQYDYVNHGEGVYIVYFPTAFSNIPVVFLSFNNAPGSENDFPNDATGGYRNVSPSSFEVHTGYANRNQSLVGFSWMAIGPL